jgi:hypothetical protein
MHRKTWKGPAVCQTASRAVHGIWVWVLPILCQPIPSGEIAMGTTEGQQQHFDSDDYEGFEDYVLGDIDEDDPFDAWDCRMGDIEEI